MEMQQIHEKIHQTQSFLKAYRNMERSIESWPQIKPVFEKRVVEAQAKVDIALRELQVQQTRLNKELADNESAAKFVVTHKERYDDYCILIEQDSIELAERLKKAVDAIA